MNRNLTDIRDADRPLDVALAMSMALREYATHLLEDDDAGEESLPVTALVRMKRQADALAKTLYALSKVKP
jgi:hypothetical protein